MNEQFYRELDPEKRWKLLQAASETPEKQRAEELFLLRHQDPKTGQRDVEKDRYLWFLLSLIITASKKPFFAKSEARRVLKELHGLGYKGNTGLASEEKFKGKPEEGNSGERKDSLEKRSKGEAGTSEDDVLFRKEMQNAAARFFSTSSHDGGRRLLGVGRPSEELRLQDQCRDAWRLIYGAPMYLNLWEELESVSTAVKMAYLTVDDTAAERLEAYDRKMRPKAYKE